MPCRRKEVPACQFADDRLRRERRRASDSNRRLPRLEMNLTPFLISKISNSNRRKTRFLRAPWRTALFSSSQRLRVTRRPARIPARRLLPTALIYACFSHHKRRNNLDDGEHNLPGLVPRPKRALTGASDTLNLSLSAACATFFGPGSAVAPCLTGNGCFAL